MLFAFNIVCTESSLPVIPQSRQTRSYYVLQNGLKLCELTELSTNLLNGLGCPEFCTCSKFSRNIQFSARSEEHNENEFGVTGVLDGKKLSNIMRLV